MAPTEVSAPPDMSPPAEAEPSAPPAQRMLARSAGVDVPRPATPERGPEAPTAAARPRVVLSGGRVLRAEAGRGRPAPVVVPRTRGERLASAAGGRRTVDESGIDTVVFPWAAGLRALEFDSAAAPFPLAHAEPPPPAAAAPFAQLARQHEDAPPPSPPPSPPDASPVPHTAAAGAAPDQPDMEGIYQHVVDRLRRDLIAERERIGDMLGELH
jgi:hypothetical protein